MRDVKECKKSTILEAWHQIVGTPQLFNEEWKERVANVEFVANKTIPNLIKDRCVVFQVKDKPAIPTWERQLRNPSTSEYSRCGVGYLSVHKVFDPRSNNKYTNYEKEILPLLNTWLDIYNEGIANSSEQKVATISYGYVNKFEFDYNKEFNPSEYFNIGVAVGYDQQNITFDGVASSFLFTDKKDGSKLSFNIEVLDSGIDNKVKVVTHSTATSVDNSGQLSFANKDLIKNKALEAKIKARDLFFSIITDKCFAMLEPT